MKAYLYIDNDKIGEVYFTIIDANMGVISGDLVVNEIYKKYQRTIQQNFESQGISNIDNFNFRILLEDNTELKPQGGIGVTDSKDFDEINVECNGLDLTLFEN